MCRQFTFILYSGGMLKEKPVSEKNLTALAKRFRKKAGKNRAEAAREMGVAQTSIFQAEEMPEQALFKLRSRMIEKYSGFKVVGPVFLLRPK
jgi:DNA-binding XRE family transcriptional regulator